MTCVQVLPHIRKCHWPRASLECADKGLGPPESYLLVSKQNSASCHEVDEHFVELLFVEVDLNFDFLARDGGLVFFGPG